MMKFALNYSPQAAALLREGRIEVDVFKCPDWPDLIAEARGYRPVYIHFPFQAGMSDPTTYDLEHLERVAALRADTDTPYINTHISPRPEDLTDPNNADVLVERVIRDIMPLVERFGVDHVIAENIPFPETKRDMPPLCVDPGVITRIVRETGCGLLLDIGHARRTAEHFAIDPRRYMAQLPIDRLREIHITGLGYTAEGERIDHLPMREDDWDLLGWVLDNIRRGDWPEPWIVACEYGGIGKIFDWRSDPDVIAAQIPRMAAMVREASQISTA